MNPPGRTEKVHQSRLDCILRRGAEGGFDADRQVIDMDEDFDDPRPKILARVHSPIAKGNRVWDRSSQSTFEVGEPIGIRLAQVGPPPLGDVSGVAPDLLMDVQVEVLRAVHPGIDHAAERRTGPFQLERVVEALVDPANDEEQMSSHVSHGHSLQRARLVP